MKYTQCINKVELAGFIGSAKVTEGSGWVSAMFSVATNLLYHDKDKNTVIETTWTVCSAFENKKISAETLRSLKKGTPVHVIGRLKNLRYTTTDGTERYETEVVVTELEVLENRPDSEE